MAKITKMLETKILKNTKSTRQKSSFFVCSDIDKTTKLEKVFLNYFCATSKSRSLLSRLAFVQKWGNVFKSTTTTNP